MARLADTLSRTQLLRLESGEVLIRVDLSVVYPGCFIVEDLDGHQAAGSSARLALDGLTRSKAT